MRTCLLFLIIFMFLPQIMPAQELLKTAEKVEISSNLKDGFYLLKSEENKMPPGVEVAKRLGNEMYIIRFSGKTNKAFSEKSSLYKVSPEWKLSPDLRKASFKDSILLSVKTLDAKNFRGGKPYKILQQYRDYLVLKASRHDLLQLIQDDNVSHIGKYSFPKVETRVSYNDLSVNAISYLQHQFPEARGENMKVSVKENLFDTSDIDLRNRIFPSQLQGERLDQHATVIATLIAGAGNTSSKGKGVAPAAKVGSSSFLQVFPDPSQEFITKNISVQNHSYGTSIEYEYGNEAAAYDASVHELPWVVHVFSSGNLGNESPTEGKFAGSSGFGNLTGNFKMAKNILTVGAMDANEQIPAQSSKGPAYDGRLKPELVAYAPAGTSDAAALVSGTVLLLQEEFLKQEQRLPSSALIRSVLMAGAEDVGLKNIDFSSGYGNLDATASMHILRSGTFFEGKVTEAETAGFTIEIPEGTKEIRIALAWIDLPANPGDASALIHDLDLQLIGPDGMIWEPWVLETGSGAEGLEVLAKRSRDSLNPAELLSLDSPAAGTYRVQVSAAGPIDSQDFSIAYTTETENTFTWTYPTASDALGQENILRWENAFGMETAQLEIRSEDGIWRSLAENVDLHSEKFPLSLDTSGTAQLKMTIGTQEFLSDVFPVAPEILPEIAYNCEEEFLLIWDKIEGASAYEVKYLGSQYMEPALTVQDTSALIQKSENNSKIWAVTPLFGDLRGPNGRAIDQSLQGVGCHYRNFFAFLEQGPLVNTILNLSSNLLISEVRIFRENSGEIDLLKNFPAPLDYLELEIADTAPKPGINSYYAVIELEDGTQIKTNDIDIFIPGENTFEVYPNPIKSGEILSIRSKGDNMDVEVFDFQGRRLSQDILVRYTDGVELKFYARGMYFIRALRNKKEIGVAKIIVF